jgi:hypothetical protein
MTLATLEPRTDALSHYSGMEHLLLGDLRELLEEQPDLRNRRALLVILDALLETLPRQFLLKEEGGYLAEVLDRYPSWLPQVQELRRDHTELYVTLARLRDRIARRAPFRREAREARRELRRWMDSLLAHERQETDLLQTAMTLDVGTGD